MLISNRVGPRSRSRRGYALAAVLAAAVCGGVAPAAADSASPAAPGGDTGAVPVVHAYGGAVINGAAAGNPQARRAHAHTIEVNSSHGAMVSRPDTVAGPGLAAGGPSTAHQPLASTGTRTLVPAVIGSAAGLAVFMGGGLVAAARGRNGFGR